MALVEGSTPHLSRETNDLLRDRLRVASLLLFTGYLVFFLKNLFYLDQFQSALDWVLFWDHFAITLVTGIIGLRMCVKCPHVLGNLRIVELIVFGGSALFFAFLSSAMLFNSAKDGYLLSIAPMWLLLIFTYALFVPNNWRRASLVIGGMVALAILVLLGTWAVSDVVADVIIQKPKLLRLMMEVPMIIIIAGIIAVGGVKSINTLRRQAFEARQLGQYRLKQLLGAGGMGEVHLAEHVLLKRPCALKLIHPDKAGNPNTLARFEREVQATATLSHWNTVEIFDYGRTDDGTFYYVMEYLPGLNLNQIVDMFGPMPAERVIHLLMQTCDALSEAHAKGLVHRDIKPGNIFAAHRGGVFDVAKLLDFGLVKPLAEIETASGVTQEGMIAGSPLFMSPEQATAERIDARSDIYSLGGVGYFLLTGRPPFDDDNPIRILMAHTTQEPAPPSQFRPNVPPDLERIILKCLAKSPDDRFDSAKALRTALSECRSAGHWTRECAATWWQEFGCPKKKQLDALVLETCHA
jgi:serine/threonine-protein kinase